MSCDNKGGTESYTRYITALLQSFYLAIVIRVLDLRSGKGYKYWDLQRTGKDRAMPTQADMV